jgi:hypothetical protein
MRTSPGKLLLASLALLLADCRSSQPPPIDIGTGDGVGGADFTLIPGSPLLALCQPEVVNGVSGYYCPPSALKDAWITTQQSMTAFVAFCYDTSPANAQAALAAKIKTIPRVK